MGTVDLIVPLGHAGGWDRAEPQEINLNLNLNSVSFDTVSLSLSLSSSFGVWRTADFVKSTVRMRER
jgi:hypothetical protein